MNEHVLHGCTPTPLASYLKALAVLRLVAEQAGDPEASGYWRGDVFVLHTRLDKRDLLTFLMERYTPTPLVAPWNGGSGFYPKDNKDGIEPIASTDSLRFSRYKTAIESARALLRVLSLEESPKNEQKRTLLEALRNRASDELLRWMDAAVILSGDDPRYPPLLGTGGNDGRLDFTNNFMQRLGEVFDIASGGSRNGAEELLRAALYGTGTAALSSRAIGQFAPGSAGGPNASAGFEGEARINPWDFVLMLEGAVLLAASAVRRLESSNSAALSAPFTVRSRAGTVGNAAAGDDGDARGEIWMPLWTRPFTLEELSALLGEGRAALGARPARDGLDFARAVARLGVDRGLSAFQRYGFLMRSGKAFLATPLSRIPVQRNPQADLIDELDRGDWLSRAQRFGHDDRAPNAFRALVARLDAALFAMTRRSDRSAIEHVLRLLGRIEALAALSPRLREHILPVPPLSAPWAHRADDGSAEFRIAAALAGLSIRIEFEGKSRVMGLRPHLAPVAPDGRRWSDDDHLVCWAAGPLERSIPQVLHRRRLEAARLREGAEGEALASTAGTDLDKVWQFFERHTDDRRIHELAHGLACVSLRGLPPAAPRAAPPIPPSFALLKPFFTSESSLRAVGWLAQDRTFRLPAEIPARLAADDVGGALRLAWQRLRAMDLALPGRHAPCPPPRGDGKRLLAALAIPLSHGETKRFLELLALSPERHPDHDTAPAAEATD